MFRIARDQQHRMIIAVRECSRGENRPVIANAARAEHGQPGRQGRKQSGQIHHRPPVLRQETSNLGAAAPETGSVAQVADHLARWN
jgi:hypothetical protein